MDTHTEQYRLELGERKPTDSLHTFTIVFDATSSRNYQLACDHEDDTFGWMNAISSASFELLCMLVEDFRSRVEKEEARLADPETNTLPRSQSTPVASTSTSVVHTDHALPLLNLSAITLATAAAPATKTTDTVPQTTQTRLLVPDIASYLQTKPSDLLQGLTTTEPLISLASADQRARPLSATPLDGPGMCWRGCMNGMWHPIS